MVRFDARIVALLAYLGLPCPATAQQTAHLGKWACQFTATEHDPAGNQIGGMLREFGIEFYANGTFEAYGTETEDGTTFEFQAEGSWDMLENVISASGPELSDVAVNAPDLTFTFSGALQPDGSMTYRHDKIEPSMGHVTNRALSACQRRN